VYKEVKPFIILTTDFDFCIFDNHNKNKHSFSISAKIFLS